MVPLLDDCPSKTTAAVSPYAFSRWKCWPARDCGILDEAPDTRDASPFDRHPENPASQWLRSNEIPSRARARTAYSPLQEGFPDG